MNDIDCPHCTEVILPAYSNGNIVCPICGAVITVEELQDAMVIKT